MRNLIKYPSNLFGALFLALAAVQGGCACPCLTDGADKATANTVLFDGQSLDNWERTNFGGEGEVYIEGDAVHMEMGTDMTGITWTGPVTRMNYEIELEAQRVLGSDFFCALTFPVNDDPCTLVVGGWAGSVVGISSLDHFDAMNNNTTVIMKFENKRWYRIRLRVTPNRLQAWIDDETVVDVDTTGMHIGIRPEVDKSVPLGISCWQTHAALRNIRVRLVDGPAIIDKPW